MIYYGSVPPAKKGVLSFMNDLKNKIRPHFDSINESDDSIEEREVLRTKMKQVFREFVQNYDQIGEKKIFRGDLEFVKKAACQKTKEFFSFFDLDSK